MTSISVEHCVGDVVQTRECFQKACHHDELPHSSRIVEPPDKRHGVSVDFPNDQGKCAWIALLTEIF